MKKALLITWGVLIAFPLLLTAQSYYVFNSDNSELPYNGLYGIDFDNNDNIWFSGYKDASTGIANVSSLSRDLSSWDVYGQMDLGLGDLEDRVFYLAVDDQNTKWFCTHYGVGFLKADGTTGIVEEARDDYTRTVQTDSKGNIYISDRTKEAILVSTDNGGNWETWTREDIGMTLGRPEIYDLREDSKGQLWICTWYGVTYRDMDGTWNLINDLEDHYTHAMTIDSDDNVWVADMTYGDPPLPGKLVKILPDASIATFDSTAIEPLRYGVTDIESDLNGHVWCALNGGGLLEVKTDGSFEQYTMASTAGSLPSDSLIHLEINNGVIWASSNAGVVRLANLVNNTTSVKEAVVHSFQPKEFILYDNYPNPFNPSTSIVFDLKYDSNIQLSIYNIRGELVKNITSCSCQAGSHIAYWDGKNQNGKSAVSGIYIYRLVTDNFSVSKKMMLLK